MIAKKISVNRDHLQPGDAALPITGPQASTVALTQIQRSSKRHAPIAPPITLLNNFQHATLGVFHEFLISRSYKLQVRAR
jgi:hypothetical protein